MILSGELDIPGCDNWGVEPWSGGYATQCGLEHARDAVVVAQNAYNEQIAAAGRESGVASRLLKNIIMLESQMWPDAAGQHGEAGLYQLSRAGADTLLRWDGRAYIERCDWYFEDCQTLGYDNREPWQQELLISSVMRDANDIALLGDVLVANAAQVDQLLNAYGAADMDYLARWRITIGNYHAGPGLTSAVLDQIRQQVMAPDWDSYEQILGEIQPGVLDYIHAATGETRLKIPTQDAK